MQKIEKIMIPITILLLVFLGWAFISNSATKSPTSDSSFISKSFDSKSGEMGAVTVQVTPMNSSKFEITLSTHSVDLDFDIKEIVSLKDNNGVEYKPVSWSGERGGHHLSGELQFSTMNPQATDIFLTISDIEDEELNLEWKL